MGAIGYLSLFDFWPGVVAHSVPLRRLSVSAAELRKVVRLGSIIVMFALCSAVQRFALFLACSYGRTVNLLSSHVVWW
jgi:hypothetical protein